MVNYIRNWRGYLLIAMALGQACFAIALSYVASLYSLEAEDYRTKVELPLWFAILPGATAVGLSAYMWFSRHIDRECPWVALGWIILGMNIVVLVLFVALVL